MDGLRTLPENPAAQQHKPVDDRTRQRLQRVTKEFESLLVGYMLKSMRSGVNTSEMFGDSYGGDVLEGLFDGQMAQHVSQNSSLGLAELLYRRMTGEEMPAARTTQPRPAAPGNVRPVADTLRQRLDKVAPFIQEAADTHRVDANLLKAVIAAESHGNPQARSPKNAKGLMQLIDSTATAMGVKNVWNPRDNVLGGAKYLGQLMEQFGGDRAKALASYNAGPGAVQKHGGIPPFKETRDYVEKVLNYLQLFEQQEPRHGDND
jgi:soluble lytic murein transglycosylase-like protein